MANGEMKLCPFRDAVCWGERCVLWDDDSAKCVVVGLLDVLDDISGRLDGFSDQLDAIYTEVAGVNLGVWER